MCNTVVLYRSVLYYFAIFLFHISFAVVFLVNIRDLKFNGPSVDKDIVSWNCLLIIRDGVFFYFLVVTDALFFN